MIKRQVPLKEQVYELILEAIIKNEIKSGEVYSEQWFAEKFQISRTPVREALLQLREEGMIETIANKGVIVKPISLEDAREVFQLRMAIEGFCSNYLAEEVAKENPKAIATLKYLEELMSDESGTAFSVLDLDFHHKIIEFSENQKLLQLIAQLKNRMVVYWGTSRGIPQRTPKAYEEHTRLLDAIRNGDNNLAYKYSTEHLQNIYNDISGYLQDTDESE